MQELAPISMQWQRWLSGVIAILHAGRFGLRWVDGPDVSGLPPHGHPLRPLCISLPLRRPLAAPLNLPVPVLVMVLTLVADAGEAALDQDATMGT